MIRIACDSTCDLSEDLIERYGFALIPLHVHLGDDAYLDKVNIKPEQIYQWSDQNKTTPKTSAISMVEAAMFFEELLKDADEIICFSISGSMSSTYNAMQLAVAQLHKEAQIHIIDSENLSTGIGLMMIKSAELIAQGASTAEVLEQIAQMKARVCTSFVVDTLEYLKRGGRCSSVESLAGSLLHLHPRIEVQEGRMHASKKYRGNMKKVLLQYTKELAPSLEHADHAHVMIVHSGCADEFIQAVYEEITAMQLFREIHIIQAGSVISSHCGPGALGVLYMSQE